MYDPIVISTVASCFTISYKFMILQYETLLMTLADQDIYHFTAIVPVHKTQWQCILQLSDWFYVLL